METDAIRGYPLSAQQRQNWRADGTPHGRPARLVLRVDGALAPDRLWLALQAVVARHDVLRTRFVSSAHQRFPVQVVQEQAAVAVEQWPGRLADAVGSGDDRMVVSLVDTGPGTWLFTVRLPAGLADRLSLEVISRDLAAAYRGDPLTPPVQYVQFDSWQQVATGDADEEELDRLLDHLAAGVPTLTEVAADAARQTADQPATGALVRVPLADPDRLRALAEAAGLPVEHLVEATWSVLLARRSGQPAPLVGRIVDGRCFDELRETVGPVAVTVPIRTPLRPEDPIRRVATELAARVDRARAWQQDWAWPDGAWSDGRAGAYRLPYQFEWLTVQPSFPGGEVEFTVVERDVPDRRVTARLVGVDDGARLSLHVETASPTGTAADLAAGLGVLLAGLVDLEQRVDDVETIGPPERDRLLHQWGAGGAATGGGTVHEAFGKQARETPQAVALRCGSRRLTFAELDGATDRLAGALRAGEVGTRDLVGVWGERSTDTVVAMLAILKAGGAFVPLDPDYPDELLAHMIAEASVRLVVAPRTAHARLERLGVRPCDPESAGAAGAGPTTPGPSGPTDLAYVVFTSGSTGWPKGVAVSHGALTHYVAAVAERLGLEAGWSHATVASPAVDLGYTALFGALLTGGAFHVIPRDTLLDPSEFGAYQRSHRIDCLKTTPSHFRALLRGGTTDVYPRRRLVLGGESLERGWLTGPPAPPAGCEVVNHYGPTETCVGVLVQRDALRRPADSDDERVPLGRPLAGATVRVLDHRLRPVPVGLPGELHIGGAGLAEGYLARPDLTVERFVPDPFGTDPDARLYRTGDLVSWLPDGTLRFEGRTDEQVKVRGHRVEPGTVQRQLEEHPAVGHAVVRTVPDAGGDPQIVAYVVPGEAYLRRRAEELSQAQVDGWENVFEEVYDVDAATVDGAFDLTGWQSSYTGETLTAEEMREAVDGIVDQALDLPHEAVLEVGCGTGLLLSRIAPRARRYVATDISAAVLRTVGAWVAREPLRYPSVELMRRSADDFSGLADDSFDLVLLNSVVQYFPSAAYLRRVLAEAVRVTRPGGHVLVGDVRDLRLVEAFHASVRLHRADPQAGIAALRREVRFAVEDEGELLVAPRFFASSVAATPGVAALDVNLKRGSIHNELTGFRYDVLLRVGAPRAEQGRPAEIVWSDTAGEPADLLALTAETDAGLLLRDVPDARTGEALARWAAMCRAPEDSTVGEVTAAAPVARTAVDPQRWYDLGREKGLAVSVQPARSGRIGCYDVRVRRRGCPASWSSPDVTGPGTDHNLPFLPGLGRELAGQLRAFLEQRLPQHMVPAHLLVVPELPIGPSGKLDVGRLPDPRPARDDADRVLPRSPVEEAVAGIWRDVLGLPEVGVFESFFQLGGHSLLAVQVAYRIREELGVELSLRDFFADPTVAGLAQCLFQLLLDQDAAA
ncbi:amino acid adenylation domain-containing protein [Micromonospora sp. NBC_01740]|uniref:non-ribosomal peptide synthetase n=1 Tax=Micromonospora sp. NBC_01740 TaxID=2975986 RepID=UPI002E12A211|nr:amino acid adenylation domain-containing protein [Micromonospora sp. NBC_01740]